ncbi:MAG: hypothetical protein HYR56_20725 [Acidobacteria bacterium]|nr:hypothetical protein [Acidobacteriota bacterium]MBI3425916.1 hypothetical protein [Acidobacteriota bacterium]
MRSRTQILLWLLVVLLPLAFWLLLAVIRHERLRALYRQYFREARRERLFLSALSFYLTFAVVRYITHSIHAGHKFFRNIYVEGFHLHHLVWGILLLLGVGYLWLMQIGTGADAENSRWPSRLTAVLYGVGAALTLDEFALWLRLQDVYWAREGRESVDAVILFGTLLLISAAGAAFFRATLRETMRLFKQ